MAGVTPTQVVQPPQQPTVSVAGSTATQGQGTAPQPVAVGIQAVPEKIQQLNRQIQIAGILSNDPSSGQISVNTALGSISLSMPQIEAQELQKLEQQLLALFETQRPLSLVIAPGDPPTQAFILIPPAQIASSSSASQPTALVGAVTSPVPPAQILVPGAILPAVVLLPAEPPSSDNLLGSGQAPLPPLASPLADASRDLNLSGEPNGPLPPPASSINPNVAVPSNPLATSGFDAGLLGPNESGNSPLNQNLLQPGSSLNLNVLDIFEPGTLPPPASSNQILATVINQGPAGQILLRAGDATLFVQQPTDLKEGTVLLAKLSASRGPTPALIEPRMGDAADNLEEALSTILETDPGLARQIFANVVPQPNPALSGALFLLFNAFQQGDLRNWLGPTAAEILTKAGKAELVARISQSLSEAGRPVEDPVVGTWHSYPIPFAANGQFELLNFYVHNGKQGKQSGSGENRKASASKAVRFLIDMRLSRLGPLQLDGLVRPKQLDMIIRSEAVLPAGFDNELRQTYINTVSAIGYAGSLSFQTGKQQWLFIRNPALAGSVVT